MQPRVVLAGGYVALVAIVNVVAVTNGPPHLGNWLMLCAVVAVAAAVQSAIWNPADLTATLLFSTPPLVALLAESSPAWLIGPLAALLLAAAELNAWAWDRRGAGPADPAARRRLLHIGILVTGALAAALVVALFAAVPAHFLAGSAAGGIAAVIVAAAALALLGRLVFGRAV